MIISHSPWEALAPGERRRGLWPIGDDLPDLPILAARGRQPGPRLLVTGGVHGDEYEGPAAIHALFDGLDVGGLQGMLIGLPVVNIAAWQARARTTPADGGDLNRAFPGRFGGVTGRLAEVIFDHFVRPCTVLIDLHSGGVRLMHLPMVGWYGGGTDAEALARGFGRMLHPWLIPDVAGVLSYEAHRLGKIALGLEWGGGGSLDPSGTEACEVGLRRVMTGLEMLSSNGGHAFDDRPPIAGGYQTAETDGFFSPQVALGGRVAAGVPIGRLRDSVGEVVAEVRAARGGTVAALAHVPLLQAGDRVAYIG